VSRKKRRSSFPFQPLLRIAAFAIITQAAAAGCSSCTCEHEMYSAEYSKEHDRQVEKFEYEAPLADVWKELVDILAKRGYTLSPTAVEEKSVETDWNSETNTSYLVRVHRVDSKHITVEVKYQHEGSHKGAKTMTAERDLAIEWQLITTVEPARARDVDDKADKAGKRGGAVGRGCDRGCETGCDACLACAETCDRCDRSVKKMSP
jgi:hypothetical protein